jgi:hypothetical protein
MTQVQNLCLPNHLYGPIHFPPELQHHPVFQELAGFEKQWNTLHKCCIDIDIDFGIKQSHSRIFIGRRRIRIFLPCVCLPAVIQ